MKSVPLILALCAGIALVEAQGPLTPPGPPGPTMKTLDQVEPRKALGPSTTPLTIDTPGSYYLAGDIVAEGGTAAAIVIASGDVTLDLNGFAIRRGATAGGTGIAGSSSIGDGSHRNITIRNGHISGAFSQGISLVRLQNVVIEDIAIQGTTSEGIRTSAIPFSPNSVTIRRCRILGEAVDRIANAPVTAMSTAAINLRFARVCLIEDCTVANVAGDGISLLTANSPDTTSSGIIRGCVISRCLGIGVDLDTNSSVPQGLLVEKCTSKPVIIGSAGWQATCRSVAALGRHRGNP